MKKAFIISFVAAQVVCADMQSLKDITVTAQKTEENIIEVPISMSVVNDVNIEDNNLANLDDLSFLVPNFYLLNAGDFAGTFSSTIRGIATDATTNTTPVGLYVDGVPTSSSFGYFALMNDVERVEVLRGPQGTLYGKNTEAGVINIITKKPSNNFEGKIGLFYGEDNKKEFDLSVRTPIIKDKLFIGLSGRFYEKDGFIKSKNTSKIVDDRKNYFTKIYLRATPTDRLELSLIGSIFKVNDGGQKRNTTMVKNPRIYEGDLVEKTKNQYEDVAFKIKYEFDYFNLSSVSAYKKSSPDALADIDYSPMKLFHANFKPSNENISQELKIDGNIDELKWLLGFFASRSEATFDISMDSIKPEYQTISKDIMIDKNIGVFTHLDYALGESLNLIGGIRYDSSKNSIKSSILKPMKVEKQDSQNSDSILPKIALHYKINENLASYVSIAKGYKSGGFYASALNSGLQGDYKPESLWNYEWGFKSVFFDGKANLNTAIYYMDIKDKQVVTNIDAQRNYVTNAASATSYGFEVEGNLILNSNWSTFANFGYNKSKFDKFSDALGTYDDNYAPYAPKYTYALGAKFRGYGGFYASANVAGYGKMYYTKTNQQSKSPYELVNAKIGYEKENFDIYLYANNLFDKNYDQVGAYDTYVMMGEPREIGLQMSYRF